MAEASPQPDWFHWPPAVFEEMQERLERFYEAGRRALHQATCQPCVDVRETADRFLVDLDLPGITPEQCDVRVTGRLLSIRGTRKLPELKAEERQLRAERAAGAFAREIPLADDVQESEVTARYQAGVLHLELPKRNAARPHKVPVRVE